MIRKNHLIVWLVSIFIYIQPIYSQNLYPIKGFIYNQETNEPVQNANIVVSGTRTGTSSGSEGYFELRLEEGKYIIKISSVGFSGKELSIRVPSGNDESLKIGLLPEDLEIKDVDVFGRLYLPDRDTSINRIPLSLMTAMTRVNATDIEKQGAVTLMDAVKFVPGGWTETRGRKTKQFFSIRGQKYPYPDYSINGVWQKEFEETGYFFSALDIESVEVVRSSSALVKGLSGLVGVIDVKTKKPERETVSMLAKYGEYNNYSTNVRYGNKIKNTSFSLSASLFGTNGPPDRKGKERMANFYGNLDMDISPEFKLTAGTTYINGSRKFVTITGPGASNIASREEKYDPVNTVLSYLKLIYSGNNGASTELQTNLSYRNAEYISYNVNQGSASTNQEKDWEYGLNILHNHPLGKTNTVRIGALYNHWVAPNGKRYYTGRSCNVHTYSGVIADEQKLGKLLLDGGFRLIGGHIVEWGGFGIEGSAKGFGNVAPIEDQPAPVEWQSAVGGTYVLSGSLSLHYNFSGGSIAPRKGSLNEQGLQPENEIRFQHDMGLRFRSQNHDELSVSTFFTTRKNAIDLTGTTIVTDNDLVMELYENVNKQSYGLELAGKLNIPAADSYIFANATFMKGQREVDNKMVKDKEMPEIILNTGLLYENSGFDGNLYIHYTGPYSNNRFVDPGWVAENGDFPLGDFVSVDMTAGYTFSGKFSKRIFAEVKNLLDKKYMTVACYPDIGRIIQLGVKMYY